MAKLTIEGSDLEVKLTTLEKLGALSRGVRVPLSSVKAVRVSEQPYSELRGIRVGTGVPFVVLLGRMLFRGGKDFVAIYGQQRTAIVDLAPGAGYQRILVSGVDERVIDELRARAAVQA